MHDWTVCKLFDEKEYLHLGISYCIYVYCTSINGFFLKSNIVFWGNLAIVSICNHNNKIRATETIFYMYRAHSQIVVEKISRILSFEEAWQWLSFFIITTKLEQLRHVYTCTGPTVKKNVEKKSWILFFILGAQY